MSLSVAQGFTKSLAMTVLSEIGDKTFFAAAILAMRHPRSLVLSGCLSALVVMTVLSVVVGWAAPNLMSRTWTHHVTTVLFLGFGLWSFWDVFKGEGESDDLDEVEAKLNADWKTDGSIKEGKKGFTKSLAMTVLSEIGDKTFFAAAILAMRHPRSLVLSGCLSALVVMTVLSVVVGWAAPNLMSRTWTHHVTTVLFLGFGLWSFWDVFKGEGESDDLDEVEAKLNADWKTDGSIKEGKKDDDDLKKQQRRMLTQFFSPIFLKAFSITFFGEWGDKSQLATIGLAADENPFGVVLGGILGQALCTTAAVIGGKSLASQISEKMVELAGGILFIIFGIQSLLSTIES